MTAGLSKREYGAYALLAWVVVIGRLLPMSDGAMAMRMSEPGMPEAMALSNGVTGIGLYLLMWGMMMMIANREENHPHLG